MQPHPNLPILNASMQTVCLFLIADWESCHSQTLIYFKWVWDAICPVQKQLISTNGKPLLMPKGAEANRRNGGPVQSSGVHSGSDLRWPLKCGMNLHATQRLHRLEHMDVRACLTVSHWHQLACRFASRTVQASHMPKDEGNKRLALPLCSSWRPSWMQCHRLHDSQLGKFDSSDSRCKSLQFSCFHRSQRNYSSLLNHSPSLSVLYPHVLSSLRDVCGIRVLNASVCEVHFLCEEFQHDERWPLYHSKRNDF